MQNNQNIRNISISLLHQSKTCRRYCAYFYLGQGQHLLLLRLHLLLI